VALGLRLGKGQIACPDRWANHAWEVVRNDIAAVVSMRCCRSSSARDPGYGYSPKLHS